MTLKTLVTADHFGSPAPYRRAPVRRPGWAIERVAKARILGKSPLGAYLRLDQSIWGRLPEFLTRSRAATAYQRGLHALARQGERKMSAGTFFLRNRPQLELICRLADLRAHDRLARIAVLACSLGAEVYSLRWSLASAHPDLEVALQAVDISPEVLEAAQEGVYVRGVSDLARTPLLERLTDDEIGRMFDWGGDRLRVKPWLNEGIRWHVGDVGDPAIVDAIGPQDVVVANDFLCHMEPDAAEACLRNLARLVDAGGYLVVSGVDVDVRTKVALDLGWRPVRDGIEAIHEGDPVLRWGWPWGYWGLEPLDKSRLDWEVRYASVFQIGAEG